MQPKRSPKLSIAAAISIISVFGISIGLTVPVLALVLSETGYSSAAIGAHVSVQFLGLMLASSITPALLVRFGVSSLMIFGILSIALVLSCFALVGGFLPWLILRFFLGAAEAIIFVSADTWINQIAPQNKRGQIIGLYAAAISAGFGMGPFLLVFTGVNGPAPFLIGAIIALITLPLLIATHGHAPRVYPASQHSQWGLATKLPIPIIFTMLFGILFAAAFGLLPVYGVSLNLTPDAAARLAGVFILGGVICQFPIGVIADRMNRYRLLYLSAILAPLALLASTLVWDIKPLLFGLIFLSGGLIGSFWTIPLMLFGDNFEGSDLASINSVSAILYAFGSTVGPSIVGICMLWSPHALMFTMALATLAVAIPGLLYQFLSRNRP